VLLSGACGTEILRRGVPTPLPLWSAAALLSSPDVVREIHRDHAAAGSDVLTANTFRADRRTLAKAGMRERARDLVKAAVRLAREGAVAGAPSRRVLVAGSVAPLEDCYRPDLVPAEATLRAEHGARVGDLVAAGADLALVETMNTAREAVAALGACRAAGLPAAVSFVVREGSVLVSGEPLADAVAAVLPLSPIAVMANCCPPRVATEAVRALASAARGVAFGAYGNGAGTAQGPEGWSFEGGGASPEAYAKEARAWLALGATWVGGCCGTTPEHVKELARMLGRA
jgi:S-methylmethionine-dependent homocysteine/selenocysteine methylase